MSLIAKFTGGNNVEACLRDIQVENSVLKAVIHRMEAQQSTMLSKFEDVLESVSGMKIYFDKHTEDLRSQEGTILALHSETQELKRYVVSTRKKVIKLTQTPEEPPKNKYVVNKLSGLDLEKAANEIVATLYSKMENPHGTKLRTFYTDLEMKFGIPFSSIYKTHKSSRDVSDISKFPNRKIDIILKNIEPSKVFEYAKKYSFKSK
jgi:hypothetical protein